jgi:transposase-like protein
MSEIDWTEIALQYARGVLAVREICENFGISTSALYRRARREGWPSRKNSSRQIEQDLPDAEDTMTARLYRALDRKLGVIEQRIAKSDTGEVSMSPSDNERDARTLNSLMRLYERLNEIEGRNPIAEPSTDTEVEPNDAEQTRKELAQRFARLRERNCT